MGSNISINRSYIQLWIQTSGNSISVDTTSILTRADGQRIIDNGDAAIALKVNISDTASMLANYRTSINSANAAKVNISDTSAMLNNYYRAYSSPIFNLPAGTNIDSVVTRNPSTGALTSTTPLDLIRYANGIVASDTATMLSHYANVNAIPSITGKVNISDTSTMLTPYQRSAFAMKYTDTASMLSHYANVNAIPSITGKVNISDTSAMLTNYRNNISSLISDSSYQAGLISASVKYSDTASMLSHYANVNAIPSITGKVNISDTSAMLSNYRNNISSLINDSSYQAAQLALKVKYSDTASMLSHYANVNSIPSITGKVNYTDTSAMLSPYQRSAFAMKYSDTASMLSHYANVNSIPTITGKVNYMDTSSMLSPYQRSAFAMKYSDTTSMLSHYANVNSIPSITGKVNISDTSAMLSNYRNNISSLIADSSYQAGLISARVKYSDTASMLSHYANVNSIPSITGKVNISDTSAMLSNYRNNISSLINDSVYQAAQLALKVKYSDTASMLSHYANVNSIPSITGKVNISDTSAMLSNYYRAYASPLFNLPSGTNIDSVVTRNPSTGALTRTTPLSLVKYANGIVASDTASMLSPYVRNNSLQTGGYLKFSDSSFTLSTIANRNKLRDSLLASANTWSLAPTFSTLKKGGLLFAGTNGLLSQDSTNLYWDNTNKRLGIGASTFDATNPETFKILTGSSTSKNAVGVYGTVNDLFQYRIQNLSTGVQAQSGYTATADNGTITSGFVWMGINNSNFNYPTTYNIGVGNDVSFLGSGSDMYIANANQSKSIIFSTGKSASPYFNERMRITNAGRIGIGTNAPDTSAILDLTSSSKGLLIPRVSLASLSDASTIVLPATSLMVYNTNSGLTGGIGYYYNSGTNSSPSWTKFSTTGAANGSTWGLTGNSGTAAGTNFIGTNDNIDLVFKRNNVSSGFLGANNTAFGNASLPYNTTATNSSAFGYNSLNVNTAANNAAFGYNSLAVNTSGAFNAAFGAGALDANTSGAYNAAFGYNALGANTTVAGNSAFGYNALSTNLTGAYNAAFGYSALLANTTGASNTAFGYNSLLNNTTGTNNTAIGYNTALGITTGSNNTILGSNVTGLTSRLNNTIILADGAGNQKLYIDSTGNAGINNTNPQAQLDVQSASTTNQTVVNATGNINDFLQYNIQNTSTGTNAQSGYSATADNGNNTTGFVWIGINNSQFNYPTLYNIGGANDVSFLGSGQDMYVANANQSKSIIFSTGTSATPYFNERMRITNAGYIGIGTSTPSSLLDVTGSIYAHVSGSNNLALGSSGSTIGFISNPAQDKWSLGHGTSIGTLATSVLSWNAFGRVGIGTTSPDTSALLDLSSSSKGLLIPRVSLSSLSDASTIVLPATSLMVYNTNASLTGGTGYYYNAGTTGSPSWTRLSSGLSGWGLTGNASTTAGTNFIGTTDNIDLVFKRNSVSSGFVGTTNTALGNASLPYNSSATNNSAFGNDALFNSSGANNSAFGNNALVANTTGANNTVMGDTAMSNITTGTNNTAIGYNTGLGITTGSNNTILGSNVTGLTAALSNTIILADGAGNQRVYVNNSGQVGIGTTAPTAILDLNDGHIRSRQTTAPTIGVTTQNGITAAAIAANSTDMKGRITTTGTQNNTNTVLTITFNKTFTIAPTVIITAANSTGQACTYFVTSTTTTFVLNFKGNNQATPYFNYMVME